MSDLLSAASLILAIIAVIYSLWYPAIEHALLLPVSSHAADNRKNHAEARRMFFQKALPLCVATALAVAVFGPNAISICIVSCQVAAEQGFHAIATYDAVRAAFVFVVLLSVGSLAHMLHLTYSLGRHVAALNPKKKATRA